MKSFFRSFTHLFSINRPNYIPKRVQNVSKHFSTFFRLIVKTSYANIFKDTHGAPNVSVAHWCRRSTDTRSVFGSSLARSTLFSFSKIRETPPYQSDYFSNTLRVIKRIVLLSFSQIFCLFKPLV